jgi:hypothetical protein
MMISAPVIDLLGGPPSDDDRAGRVQLVQLSGRPGRPDPIPYGVTAHSCSRSKPSPPGLPGSWYGPAMDPSSDIDTSSTDTGTAAPRVVSIQPGITFQAKASADTDSARSSRGWPVKQLAHGGIKPEPHDHLEGTL